MGNATTSEIQVAFIQEVTPNTIPATPAFTKFDLAGQDSLNTGLVTVQSARTRPDRTAGDTIVVGKTGGGAVPMELSFGTDMDTLLEHLLSGAFSGNDLKGGILKKSMTLEKIWDHAGTKSYVRFLGSRIGSAVLTIAARQLVTFNATFLAQSYLTDTAIFTGATYVEPNTVKIYAGADLAAITLGGLTSPVLTGLTLNFNTNLSEDIKTGSLDTDGIGYGERQITGSFTAYFPDLEILDAAIAGNPLALTAPLSVGGSTGYTFLLPRIYLTDPNIAGAANRSVIQNFNFRASGADPTELTDIKITKVP